MLLAVEIQHVFVDLLQQFPVDLSFAELPQHFIGRIFQRCFVVFRALSHLRVGLTHDALNPLENRRLFGVQKHREPRFAVRLFQTIDERFTVQRHGSFFKLFIEITKQCRSLDIASSSFLYNGLPIILTSGTKSGQSSNHFLQRPSEVVKLETDGRADLPLPVIFQQFVSQSHRVIITDAT